MAVCLFHDALKSSTDDFAYQLYCRPYEGLYMERSVVPFLKHLVGLPGGKENKITQKSSRVLPSVWHVRSTLLFIPEQPFPEMTVRTTIQQAMQSLDVAQELRQQVESSSLEYKTNVGTRIEAWLQQDIDSFTSYMRDVGNKQAEKWARSSKENMAVYLSRARPVARQDAVVISSSEGLGLATLRDDEAQVRFAT
ncbi:hypothetical protein WJX82_002135 [Trebouxia sp. C0006]